MTFPSISVLKLQAGHDRLGFLEAGKSSLLGLGRGWGQALLKGSKHCPHAPLIKATVSPRCARQGLGIWLRQPLLPKKGSLHILPHFVLQQSDEVSVLSPLGSSIQILGCQLVGGRGMLSPHQPSVLAQMLLWGLFGAMSSVPMGH